MYIIVQFISGLQTTLRDAFSANLANIYNACCKMLQGWIWLCNGGVSLPNSPRRKSLFRSSNAAAQLVLDCCKQLECQWTGLAWLIWGCQWRNANRTDLAQIWGQVPRLQRHTKTACSRVPAFRICFVFWAQQANSEQLPYPEIETNSS